MTFKGPHNFMVTVLDHSVKRLIIDGRIIAFSTILSYIGTLVIDHDLLTLIVCIRLFLDVACKCEMIGVIGK